MNKDSRILVDLLKEYYKPQYSSVTHAIKSWQKLLNDAKSAGFNYRDINLIKEQVNLKVKFL